MTERSSESADRESGAVRPDSTRLQDLALSSWKTAALMSAVDLGLFTVVSRGAGTVPEIARVLDLSSTNTERLVGVLCALDLLRKEGGRLRNADDVERFLVEGGRDYAGPWILFTRPDWEKWGRLTEFLRAKDESVLGMYETLSVEDARRYHRATYSIGVGAGRRFLRQVDLRGRRLLLDLGGGSGAYSIVAARAHPELRAIVFDLPPVAEVAREFIERAGVAERVRAQPGDFTRDPLPNDVDVAIMASNLPQYSPDIIRSVIRRAFEALVPGGEMHLIGETLDDDRMGPVGPALWGLAEALHRSTGVAHSQTDCVGYFEAAGFVDVSTTPFVKGTLTRISGTRPG
jgi:SAM-dependent methyltransferase